MSSQIASETDVCVSRVLNLIHFYSCIKPEYQTASENNIYTCITNNIKRFDTWYIKQTTQL